MDEWEHKTTADEDILDLAHRIGDDHLEDDDGMEEEVDRMSHSG
jgi:hypothetical protein